MLRFFCIEVVLTLICCVFPTLIDRVSVNRLLFRLRKLVVLLFDRIVDAFVNEVGRLQCAAARSTSNDVEARDVDALDVDGCDRASFREFIPLKLFLRCIFKGTLSVGFALSNDSGNTMSTRELPAFSSSGFDGFGGSILERFGGTC